jgi:hypothetical protein
LGAIFKTDVSLEEKVKVVVRLTPPAVCADAVKAKAVPRSTEILMLGVRLTFAGKSGGPALVPLPQPVMLVMLHKERIATAKRNTFERDPAINPDLPMNSSLNIAVALRSEITQNEPSNELENL